MDNHFLLEKLEIIVNYWWTLLAKVSDWNSLRNNPKSSESFRNLYPHQTVSFRSNPKLVFNPNQSGVHSKSIQTCNPNWIRSIKMNPNFQSGQFELSIRMYPVYPNQSESFRKIRFHLDWSNWFGLTGFIRIDFEWGSDFFRLKNFFGIGIELFSSDTNSGMIRKISNWFELNFNPKLSSG